jgi:hypothetical protein
MSDAVETTQVSAQYINQNFVRKIEEGRVKEAEAAGTTFIRKKMREDSVARKILTPVTLTEDELDRALESDQPQKIVEKEPDSTATYVPFKGSGETTWFTGPRYAVRFGKVESQKFTKSKFELMTYRNDIRKILSDNSVKDMAAQEDSQFLQTVRKGIALNSAVQNITTVTFDIGGFKTLFQALINSRKPLGKMLMAKSLFYEALSLPVNTIGFEALTRQYDQGVEGKDNLWGIPVVTTIKSTGTSTTVAGGDGTYDLLGAGLASSGSGSNSNDAIVYKNEVFLFAPENWLGNFFLLQDATLFIKTEADLIQFWSYSAPGIGIGQTDAAYRLVITGV